MSTTVVYASGQSGHVFSFHATYLTAARNAATAVPSAQLVYVGQLTSYACEQTFLKWDTSAIGTDTVSNVDFEVDGYNDDSTTDFVLEGYVFDWSTTLTTADYRTSDSGIPALGSIISSYDTTGGWTLTAGYNNDLGANAAFASAINGAGDTLIVVISDQHRLESQPTTAATR